MICVILSADKGIDRFREAVSLELEKHFSVIRAHGGTLDTSAYGAELLLTDIKSFRQFTGDATIIVLKDCGGAQLSAIAGAKIAVVDSGNGKLMRHMAQTGIPAITCGLSAKDTITLSSMGIDGAVVNLQRSIINLHGTVIEPQEIPVHISGEADRFAVMAAAAVCLLCKKSPAGIKPGPATETIASHNKITHDHTSNANA
ncbi:MAG: hypothetical protein FWH02_00200 [Oscillospiraceae bacterium]|nr:hypothetical protein [Oscillospiraceae bacterium]